MSYVMKAGIKHTSFFSVPCQKTHAESQAPLLRRYNYEDTNIYL